VEIGAVNHRRPISLLEFIEADPNWAGGASTPNVNGDNGVTPRWWPWTTAGGSAVDVG